MLSWKKITGMTRFISSDYTSSTLRLSSFLRLLAFTTWLRLLWKQNGNQTNTSSHNWFKWFGIVCILKNVIENDIPIPSHWLGQLGSHSKFLSSELGHEEHLYCFVESNSTKRFVRGKNITQLSSLSYFEHTRKIYWFLVQETCANSCQSTCKCCTYSHHWYNAKDCFSNKFSN